MSDTQSVVIEETFDTSIENMWEMWTNGTHFSNWYGPQGCTIPVADIDATVGGQRRISMTMDTPNGPMEMWFGGAHLEVSPVTRLVYSEVMTDPEGNPLPASAMGMPGDEPFVTEVTVELEDLGSTTKVTMTHAGVPAGSPGEFGWRQALEKLSEYVKK